jgi:hypothetical protein
MYRAQEAAKRRKDEIDGRKTGIYEYFDNWTRDTNVPPAVSEVLNHYLRRRDSEAAGEFGRLIAENDGVVREYSIKVYYNLIVSNEEPSELREKHLKLFVKSLINLLNIELDREIMLTIIYRLSRVASIWPDHGLQRKIVPELINTLYRHSNDTEIRKAAIVGLREFARDAAPAIVNPLLMALEDDHVEIRLEACVTLARLGSEVSVAVPRLVEVATNDPDTVVRVKAIEALLSSGVDSEIIDFLTSDSGSHLRIPFNSELSFAGEKGSSLRRMLSDVSEAMIQRRPTKPLKTARVLHAKNVRNEGSARNSDSNVSNVTIFKTKEAIAEALNIAPRTLFEWEQLNKIRIGGDRGRYEVSNSDLIDLKSSRKKEK